MSYGSWDGLVRGNRGTWIYSPSEVSNDLVCIKRPYSTTFPPVFPKSGAVAFASKSWESLCFVYPSLHVERKSIARLPASGIFMVVFADDSVCISSCGFEMIVPSSATSRTEGCFISSSEVSFVLEILGFFGCGTQGVYPHVGQFGCYYRCWVMHNFVYFVHDIRWRC